VPWRKSASLQHRQTLSMHGRGSRTGPRELFHSHLSSRTGWRRGRGEIRPEVSPASYSIGSSAPFSILKLKGSGAWSGRSALHHRTPGVRLGYRPRPVRHIHIRVTHRTRVVTTYTTVRLPTARVR